MTRQFHNPILPGFYPDPSICRVGEDYYLVTSTFEYFPGLPLFHSRDLVHWRQLGHVLNRPSQLDLDGIRPSGGLYAPTIRHANGVFYVICTLVDGKRRSGNFIVTAADPAGSWSEPYWLDNAPGIDPSLLFDDDGRVWFCGTRAAAHARFEGHTEIYVQELDLPRMQLVGEPVVVWDGAMRDATWSEAPHIYKIGNFYYLMTAEGGTAHHHAVVIARSETVTGPYVGNPGNPILTHRHLGREYPIVGTGHAELVETQNGEWWMVLLAMRPYGGYYYNLGRETFLAPVRWEDGWPIVSPGSGRVEATYPVPNLEPHAWPAAATRDDFNGPALNDHWNFLRTPREPFWSLGERPGHLTLRLRPERLSDLANPSFVGRRQRHMHFLAGAAMDFTPLADNECAGIVLLQNNDFHFHFVVTRSGGATVARLIRRSRGEETLVAESPVDPGLNYLWVEAHEQAYSFYISADPDNRRPVAEAVDGRILSTPVAGGFVGTYIGLYASSNGQPGANQAHFDWFDYQGL